MKKAIDRFIDWQLEKFGVCAACGISATLLGLVVFAPFMIFDGSVAMWLLRSISTGIGTWLGNLIARAILK